MDQLRAIEGLYTFIHRQVEHMQAIMRYRPTNADQASLKVKTIKAFDFMTGIEPTQEDIDALIDGMLWD